MKIRFVTIHLISAQWNKKDNWNKKIRKEVSKAYRKKTLCTDIPSKKSVQIAMVAERAQCKSLGNF